MEFKDVVASYLANDPKLKKKLAEEFAVAPSSVELWATGIARPHPSIQKLIISFIQSGD